MELDLVSGPQFFQPRGQLIIDFFLHQDFPNLALYFPEGRRRALAAPRVLGQERLSIIRLDFRPIRRSARPQAPVDHLERALLLLEQPEELLLIHTERPQGGVEGSRAREFLADTG